MAKKKVKAKAVKSVKSVKFATINRDISWLSFNERVLQEAADDRVPLIERVRFLGIFSNNLDEFFRVRVATLRRMSVLDAKSRKELGFDPRKILDKIQKIVVEQQKQFEKIFQILIRHLEKKGIRQIDETQLTPEQGAWVKEYFQNTVRQTLVPIMLDKKSKITSLRDKMIYLAIKLSSSKDPSHFQYALIEIPTQVVPRFTVIPDKNKDKTSIIILDDVIRYCLDEIFSIFDYDVHEAYTVKVTRDAELDIDTDVSQSFLEKIQRSVKRRRLGLPVRFIYDAKIPRDLLQFILRKVKLEETENIIAAGRYHNFKDFINFPAIGQEAFLNEELPPLAHPSFSSRQSMFDVIRKKDILLNFPYQSFSYIIELLREAAIDPKVTKIEINLYRVGEKSKIINALINAAKNGKQVTAVIELQARFDEEINIKLSNKLQEEGVRIIFGVPGLKVHSKLILITRKEKKQSRLYAHIGTGNFHERNAKVYTDHSLLTSDNRITGEVQKVFEFFRKNFERANFKYLFVSPFNMRKRLIELINEEIRNIRRQHEAYIILKLNNLVDEEMIRRLYQASQEGVKIKIIVRGICSLIPGVKGMSENIEVISIVDRFLEHSRIYVFGNDGNPIIYISSADFMPRNLDGRIEVAAPIFDPELKKMIIDLLNIQLNANSHVRIIDADQSNHYKRSKDKTLIRAQVDTYNYFKEYLSKV